jgi:hypothetical protein
MGAPPGAVPPLGVAIQIFRKFDGIQGALKGPEGVEMGEGKGGEAGGRETGNR